MTNSIHTKEYSGLFQDKFYLFVKVVTTRAILEYVTRFSLAMSKKARICAKPGHIREIATIEKFKPTLHVE